nr:phytanoyl-CoA dioxygenase family protein [Paenibacillus mangrovi]
MGSDQALFKEPGGGHTPWHQDQNYWPVATNHTVTMWMPLVPISEEVGSMTFVSGEHKRGFLNRQLIRGFLCFWTIETSFQCAL